MKRTRDEESEASAVAQQLEAAAQEGSDDSRKLKVGCAPGVMQIQLPIIISLFRAVLAWIRCQLSSWAAPQPGATWIKCMVCAD